MSDFKERTIEPIRLGYVSKGREVVVWRDIETGEEFHIYAADLMRMLDGMAFAVQSKVINRSGGYDSKKALRIEKAAE